MSKIKETYKDEDIEFTMETNYDVDKWVKHLSDTKPILKHTSIYMINLVKKRFDEQRGPKQKWSKLTPFTLGIKGRSKSRVMFRTGRLYNSIRAWSYVDSISVGWDLSEVPYARLLHQGADYSFTKKQSVYLWAGLKANFKDVKVGPFSLKKAHLPARPSLGFTKKNLNHVGTMFDAWAKASENMSDIRKTESILVALRGQAGD